MTVLDEATTLLDFMGLLSLEEFLKPEKSLKSLISIIDEESVAQLKERISSLEVPSYRPFQLAEMPKTSSDLVSVCSKS